MLVIIEKFASIVREAEGLGFSKKHAGFVMEKVIIIKGPAILAGLFILDKKGTLVRFSKHMFPCYHNSTIIKEGMTCSVTV
jgi:hypothetical protein